MPWREKNTTLPRCGCTSRIRTRVGRECQLRRTAGGVRRNITSELHDRMAKRVPDVTEDTMPGELANCIPHCEHFQLPRSQLCRGCGLCFSDGGHECGRRGVGGKHFHAVITGGMTATWSLQRLQVLQVRGLSTNCTRPYAKELTVSSWAKVPRPSSSTSRGCERDGDKIYAVLRGMGGVSDGKGRGIRLRSYRPEMSVQHGFQTRCRLVACHCHIV